MTKSFVAYWASLNKALAKAKCPDATAQEAEILFRATGAHRSNMKVAAEFLNSLRGKIESEGSL
ncbi:hypothetical protein [uncultured Bradyrhizobium sp.]|uniref:hypothetical protein n=1 Tax=uncultured Bradyrhizobium sp. TaxID=199684 RepID=UPI0035CB16C4